MKEYPPKKFRYISSTEAKQLVELGVEVQAKHLAYGTCVLRVASPKWITDGDEGGWEYSIEEE